MIGLDEAQALIDQDVEMRHWTGMRITGRLVGVCDQPSVIYEDEDGVRYTYGIGSIESINATSPRKEQS